MAQPTQKKPVNSKPENLTNLGDFYANPYELAPDLKKELTEKGLEWRFINAVRFKEMGFHRSHWMPYKRDQGKAGSSLTTAEQIFGADPEGFVRRGSDILAVKPRAAAQAHRDHLKRLTRLQESSYKSKGAQIKDAFKEAGIKGKVLEGYDEEESSED